MQATGQFGVNIDRIKRLNGEGRHVYIGQTLTIAP